MSKGLSSYDASETKYRSYRRRRSRRRRSQALLIAAGVCGFSCLFFLFASLDSSGNPGLRLKIAGAFLVAALLLLLSRSVGALFRRAGERRWEPVEDRPDPRSGLVLPAALIVGAALSALALHALAAARAETRAAEAVARARRLGAAAAAEALRRLGELAADDNPLVDHLGENWARAAAYTTPAGVRVISRVEDEERRFNLNNLTLAAAEPVARPVSAALADLLVRAGAGDARRRVEALRAALRDPEASAKPRSRPLADWAQLADIPGFDREFLESPTDDNRRKIRPADTLTVIPFDPLRPSPINLNTASAEVLTGFFGRERPDLVRAIEELRQTAPLSSVAALSRRLDPLLFNRLAPWMAVHSTHFRITVNAADERDRRSVQVLARRDLQGRVRVLEWTEN